MPVRCWNGFEKTQLWWKIKTALALRNNHNFIDKWMRYNRFCSLPIISFSYCPLFEPANRRLQLTHTFDHKIIRLASRLSFFHPKQNTNVWCYLSVQFSVFDSWLTYEQTVRLKSRKSSIASEIVMFCIMKFTEGVKYFFSSYTSLCFICTKDLLQNTEKKTVRRLAIKSRVDPKSAVVTYMPATTDLCHFQRKQISSVKSLSILHRLIPLQIFHG